MIPPRDHSTFRRDATAVCRCGRRVSFGVVVRGFVQEPVAVHDGIPCEAYLNLELVQYMRYVRGHEAFPA